MNNKQRAEAIISKVGGVENIKTATHCVTRLRLILADESKVEMEELKKVDGVINVIISSGQYQVVLGPIVNDVYAEVEKITGGNAAAVEAPAEKKNWKSIPKDILDYVISCFVPAIPVFAGAGMVKVFAVILSSVGFIEMGSTTYTLLNGIGGAIFYFLPFVVAFNAANKLKVNPFLALAVAAVCMCPDFTGLAAVEGGVSFFGLPVSVVDYSSQAIPMMIAVFLLKYVDKFAAKVSPKLVEVFLRTMIDLVVVCPIIILVVGPVSIALSNFLFQLSVGMMSWGWLAVGINALLFPLMVLTGTHNATIPLIIQLFATQGFDPIFLVCGLAANIAEAGAACAVAVKTKNKNLKSVGFSATLSALLGITEPALYGVNLRLKRPFIAMLIGAFLGGCFNGFVGLAAPAFATPSLITCAFFVPQGKNVLLGFLAVAVTFVITFAITYVMGFEDLKDGE